MLQERIAALLGKEAALFVPERHNGQPDRTEALDASRQRGGRGGGGPYRLGNLARPPRTPVCSSRLLASVALSMTWISRCLEAESAYGFSTHDNGRHRKHA